jgi:putative ABC transport system permease protein
MVAVAALSLGLGIGATTTMYSLVNRVTNYDLGFSDVDRLVLLWSTNSEQPGQQSPPTFDIVRALLDSGTSFEAFGLFQGGGAPVTIAGVDQPGRVEQMPVDVNALALTGINPLLGRTYREQDFEDVVKQKEARSIVVSYDTWQRRLGGRPDVIGSTIRIDGEPRPVIGVMPRNFALLPWADDIAFWAANDLRRIPQARWMLALGRLKPGVTLAAAEAEATAVTRHQLEALGQRPDTAGARLESIHDAYFGDAADGTTFILGAVSLVLLIGCANVANLLLASGVARRKELAVRAAVGAGRHSLLRQMLTESLLLSLLGGVVGVMFAYWGVRLFVLIVPADFPNLLRQLPIDARVLGFALAISVASSLIFGLVPALRASRLDLNEVFKDAAPGAGGGRRTGRSALLVAEVSLSMVLLVGAGLMLRGFLREQRDLPGFETQGLLTADLLLGGTRYFDKTPDDMNLVTGQSEVFFDRLLERVRAMPGVTHAGIISRLPLQVWTHPFTIVGQPVPEPQLRPQADLNEADAGLLETLGVRLLRGRWIEDSDVASSQWIAVVNKTFADRHFPDGNAIGQSIRVSVGPAGRQGSVDEPQPREIVGVVANMTYPSFVTEMPAAIYIPFRQHLSEYGAEDEWLHTRKVLAVRASGDPLLLVSQVERAITEVDPDQVAESFLTMDQRVATSPSVTNSRFFASLFSAFGVLAILLAMIGVYGVTSWVVGQRTTEFGIRMALGARAGDVVLMLLGQSLRPILVGVSLGVLGGWGLGQALNSLFFRMAAADPWVFVQIATLMIAAALGAAWVPTHRVTRLDPSRALRAQ